MAKTRDIPLNTYPTGVRQFVKNTPNGLSGFQVSIARCTSADPTIWPDPNSRIKILVECSYDDGLSFPPNGGSASFEGSGGIATGKLGEIPFSIMSCRFSPNEPNAVRITVEIINGPIKTFGDVTVN